MEYEVDLETADGIFRVRITGRNLQDALNRMKLGN